MSLDKKKGSGIKVEVVSPMTAQRKQPKKEAETYIPKVEEVHIAGNKNVVHGKFDKSQKVPIVEIGRPRVDN